MVKDFEEALHQPMAAGIDLREVTNLCEGVGAVTTSAAGDFHLGEYVLTALEDGNIHLRHHLFQVYSQEKSCRPTAYDCCPQV
jgi:hypothetical protein